jgi:hypothetical protein
VPATDRSIGSLLYDIAANLQEIVRSEVRMIRTQLGDQVAKAKTAGMWLGLGALSGIFLLLFLLLAAFFALARVMPDWGAALAMAAAMAVLAAILLTIGAKRFRAVEPMPQAVSHLEGSLS